MHSGDSALRIVTSIAPAECARMQSSPVSSCFLWKAQFCNSRICERPRYSDIGWWRTGHFALHTMIEHDGISRSEFAKPFKHNGLAPIEELSPTKRKALIACFQGDGLLYKRSGTWTSSNTGPHMDRFSGVTVADLSRDGLLEITIIHKYASARLTARGVWFAKAVANHPGTNVADTIEGRSEQNGLEAGGFVPP